MTGNPARLAWHLAKRRDTAEYFWTKNKTAMAAWRESWVGVDRSDPHALLVHADLRQAKGVRLINASVFLEGERHDGALQRAGRLLRDADVTRARAHALLAGQSPPEEWEQCECGAAFQPGIRGYTSCWTCSSAEWYRSSYTCVFCQRRHSMRYGCCFLCKADGREDDARFLRNTINIRDSFICNLCGLDVTTVVAGSEFDDADHEDGKLDLTGSEMQVVWIVPEAEGGTLAPYNLESLCSTCLAIRGKQYDTLDSTAWWTMVRLYAGPLFDYLLPDERAHLLALEPDTEREQVEFGRPVPWRETTVVYETDGFMTALAAFPDATREVTRAEVAPVVGPDPCQGEVVLSTGRRPCRNTTDLRFGSLCMAGCR